MADEVYVERQATPASLMRRISWGAVIAGLLVSIAIQMLLTLLGASIGAASIDPLREQNPGRGLATGSAIWVGVSALIAIWVGACVAGRLSGGPRRMDGLLHGVVTWSLSTVVMMTLLTTAAGSLLGGTASLMSNAIGSAANAQGGLQALAQRIQNEAPQILSPTGRAQGTQRPEGQLAQLGIQDPELGAALAQMTAKGGAANAPDQRDKVVNLLTTRHNMDQAQATTIVNDWDQQMQSMKARGEQQAREVGDTAARGVSKGALFAFIALLLGLMVSAWGGWVGTASLPRYHETEVQPVA